jgi:RNA recognition motif-containing protein
LQKIKLKLMDIFIKSLPFKFKEKDLQNLFEVFGEVTKVSLVMDKMTRQSKGFGFVTMTDDEAALIAQGNIIGGFRGIGKGYDKRNRK